MEKKLKEGQVKPKQRKLIMMCSTNYLLIDLQTRKELGFYGGDAVTSMYVPTDSWELSCFDKSNVFIHIITPEYLLKLPTLLNNKNSRAFASTITRHTL